MDNNYTVYIHIFPNNKVYIGITCRNPRYRWNNGKNYRTQELMFRAIKKYGWDNIEHKILFENLSKEEAEQKEIELIAEYKSNQRKFGYNVENGGNCKGTVSEETKEKISKNNAKYWLGKKLSEETKKKMSKNMKNKKIKKESIIKGLKTKKERFPNGIPISEQEALDTIKAWGFEYKTIGFNWIKKNKNGSNFFGVGWYTKSNSEVCLIGVKGKPFKQSNSVSQIIETVREEHSKKPAIVRDKIVEFCGDIPRIELFARQYSDGWDCWGDEV